MTITMDDGKANALSPSLLADLGRALDRAAADVEGGGAVVLQGRDGVFSAGFDLNVLRGGGPEASDMVLTGFATAARLMSFPAPVVVACTGHAIAMGAFLLLAADYRIGTHGTYRVAANEVAIGLTLPRSAVVLLEARLTPAAFQRAALLAESFGPDDAVAAGFLDRVVEPGDAPVAAANVAAELNERLVAAAHAESKLRARADVLARLHAAISADAEDLRSRRAD